MRFTLLFACSVLVLALCGQKSYQTIEPLDSATVKKAAFIGLVRMREPVGDFIDASILRLFKSSKPWGDVVQLRMGYDLPAFHEGEVYLIFAEINGAMRLFMDKNSRVIQKENSERDIAFLLSMLPCADPKLKNHNQACHRIFRPVCGCDNKTYSNSCEALKNGILMFSLGECK